ncbi:uncharacterized protein YbjQ (UPF0145 family) [Microbacterium sp. SORGH_AS 421]|nr:uncharacterized protein YbjQ (UPF0145 family) [Microbacterium sp. SORGH_AS_0421]
MQSASETEIYCLLDAVWVYTERLDSPLAERPVTCDTGRMLVTTMNDVPGRQIVEVYGEVTGLTVRARNIGVQFGAGLKSIFGGELQGLTKQLQDSRDEAKQRLVEAAEAVGADAVIAMRFDTSEVAQNFQEVVAYGTAVKLG